MTYSTNLTSKGQVTVPVSIRRRLGLKPGEPVRFRITENDQIVIEKNSWKDNLNTLHNEIALQLRKNKVSPLSDEELDQAINQAGQKSVVTKYRPAKGKGR